MSDWIYILGERSGLDLKIGKTSRETAAPRLGDVNNEFAGTNPGGYEAEYVLLGAVLGSPKDEAALLREFKHLRRKDRGSRREYFYPEPELVEYAAWLRAQWYCSAAGLDKQSDWTRPPQSSDWLPADGRRRSKPKENTGGQGTLLEDWEAKPGILSGTAWAWFVDPDPTQYDYFTPVEIVDAARRGMGGIDLDAASHYGANQLLRIDDYMDPTRSAFDHNWKSRVWLNPPYGENGLWWPRVREQIDADYVDQICILSMVSALNTQLALPLWDIATAMVLLVNAPIFWGNKEGRTGTNMPHAILYIGDRSREVMGELKEFGIVMKPNQEVREMASLI
jgi:hypothetical protein